ncbi:MAG: helix-turn-helix domain-containing protein [Cyanobacteriota bacterium]
MSRPIVSVRSWWREAIAICACGICPPKEFALTEALLRYGKRLLVHTAIIEQVWSWSELPEEETIKTYIKNLRAKLKADR